MDAPHPEPYLDGAALDLRRRFGVVRPPPPALAPFVFVLGYSEAYVPGTRELLAPIGCMALSVHLDADRHRWYTGAGFTIPHERSGAVLWAAADGPICLDTTTGGRIIYAYFRPGGAYPFFPPPPSAIDETGVDLAELWGRDGATLRDQLLSAPTPAAALDRLERLLLARAVRPLADDPALHRAATALTQGAPVSEVADRLGVSDRTLQRRFTTPVGLTPKRFARVGRLQRLLHAIPLHGKVDWARMAAECGYFDQAHMVNDFRALTGLTPGSFRPRGAGLRYSMPLDGDLPAEH